MTQVLFTPEAWGKMADIIQDPGETHTGFHGLVRRDDSGEGYIVYDILSYPQHDQTEYDIWLMSQEDEVFNHIRLLGRTHKGCGDISRINSDTAYMVKLVKKFQKDVPNKFYIFTIWNREMENYAAIYDAGGIAVTNDNIKIVH